jgi:hypothetical protein
MSFIIGHALDRAFLMPNSSRLATRQTPALQLITTDILLVTVFPTFHPSTSTQRLMAKSPADMDRMHRGQGRAGTTKDACFSVTPSLLTTHPDDRRARATSFHFIRHDTVAISFPTIAGVQLEDDCIAVST